MTVWEDKDPEYRAGYMQALADVRAQLKEASKLAARAGHTPHERGLQHAVAVVRGLIQKRKK